MPLDSLRTVVQRARSRLQPAPARVGDRHGLGRDQTDRRRPSHLPRAVRPRGRRHRYTVRQAQAWPPGTPSLTRAAGHPAGPHGIVTLLRPMLLTAMLRLAGASNAVDGLCGYRQLVAEAILIAAPDTVVTTVQTTAGVAARGQPRRVSAPGARAYHARPHTVSAGRHHARSAGSRRPSAPRLGRRGMQPLMVLVPDQDADEGVLRLLHVESGHRPR